MNKDFQYMVGDYITHKSFGEGKIKSIKDDITFIDFKGYGELKFKISAMQEFIVE